MLDVLFCILILILSDYIVLYCMDIFRFIFTFPSGSVVKNLASAGDEEDGGSVPGSGRSPGEGNGNPLQCSCLGNPINRGAWWATVHGVAKSQT